MGTELSPESDAANRPLVGKCGCGRVRYRVVDAFLYAANFAEARVDVFDHTWSPANSAGGFADPTLPAGYAPFAVYFRSQSSSVGAIVSSPVEFFRRVPRDALGLAE